jgi:uncharacterized protein
VDETRWLADEMLGRLARYLRFLGYDTAYVRGLDDRSIAERCRTEGRILITRDRALAARVPRAILLQSPELAEQLRSLRQALPNLRTQVRFERCTVCNGRLAIGNSTANTEGIVPPPIRSAGAGIFRCVECGHIYWEGSHTAEIRRHFSAWFGTSAA